MKYTIFALLFLQITSCATSPNYNFVSSDQLSTLTKPSVSTLPAYDLTGGIWLENQPLLINKEFNFGAAMAIEGVGTAIAVGMRNKKNKELAELLAPLPPLQLNQRLKQILKRHSLVFDKTQEIAVYGLLYGQPTAHLRTIIEIHNSADHLSSTDKSVNNIKRYIHYSPWAPIGGEKSWTKNNGEMLWNYFERSMNALADLIEQDIQTTTKQNKDKEGQKYSIKGGESIQRGRGYVIGTKEDVTFIQSTDMPDTLLLIPNDVLTIEKAE